MKILEWAVIAALLLACVLMIAACAPREPYWGELSRGLGEVQRHAR